MLWPAERASTEGCPGSSRHGWPGAFSPLQDDGIKQKAKNLIWCLSPGSFALRAQTGETPALLRRAAGRGLAFLLSPLRGEVGGIGVFWPSPPGEGFK